MNTTLATKAVSTGKRLKLQHIALVSGLAIAVSAAVAIGAWEGRSTSASTPKIRNHIQPVIALPRAQSEFVYYLVGSQEDARAIQSAIGSVEAAYDVTQANFDFALLVVDTQESEALAAYLVRGLTYYAPETRIVDLRSRVAGDVYLGPGSEYYSESYLIPGVVTP